MSPTLSGEGIERIGKFIIDLQALMARHPGIEIDWSHGGIEVQGYRVGEINSKDGDIGVRWYGEAG